MDDVPRRTVPIKLDVPEERRGDLHQTKKQFLHCTNHTSEWAWRIDDYCVTSKSKAVDALYGELREETDLTATRYLAGWRANPPGQRFVTPLQGGSVDQRTLTKTRC